MGELLVKEKWENNAKDFQMRAQPGVVWLTHDILRSMRFDFEAQIVGCRDQAMLVGNAAKREVDQLRN